MALVWILRLKSLNKRESSQSFFSVFNCQIIIIQPLDEVTITHRVLNSSLRVFVLRFAFLNIVNGFNFDPPAFAVKHTNNRQFWWPVDFFFFFLSGFSFSDTDDSQESRGREGTIFYSTLPLPPAHEHSDIYLQLCMWDDYHITCWFHCDCTSTCLIHCSVWDQIQPNRVLIHSYDICRWIIVLSGKTSDMEHIRHKLINQPWSIFLCNRVFSFQR